VKGVRSRNGPSVKRLVEQIMSTQANGLVPSTKEKRPAMKTTGRRWAAVSLLALASVGVAGCRRPLPGGTDPAGSAGTAPAAAEGTTTSTTGSAPTTVTTDKKAPTKPPTTPPAAPASIRSVDLDSATYPTAACPPAYRLPGGTFTMRGGHAGAPFDGPSRGESGIGVDRRAETYGDLDGDGREDVAVHLNCGIARSDGLSDGVAVMGLRDGRLHTLAAIPDSGVPATGVEDVTHPDGSVTREPVALEYQVVTGMHVADGLLEVQWLQSMLGGDALGQGYNVTVTYRIHDGRADQVRVSERVPRPRG
jgi:hypothetical protein